MNTDTLITIKTTMEEASKKPDEEQQNNLAFN